MFSLNSFFCVTLKNLYSKKIINERENYFSAREPPLMLDNYFVSDDIKTSPVSTLFSAETK